MSEDRIDDLIKERFAELKSAEQTRVPDFAEMYARAKAEASQLATTAGPAGGTEDPRVIPLAGARRRVLRGRWPLAAGTLAAAALAGIMLLQPDDADAEFEALVTAFAADNASWQSPTDELLKVPGFELVNSIPAIGGPYGAPLDTPNTPRGSGDATG